MHLFWKALAAVFITLILVLTLDKQGRDFSAALTTLVCCMIGVVAFSLLEPVVSFAWELQAAAGLEGETLKTLMKLAGIGLTGEMAHVICTDAGCSALGKAMQLMTSALILSLSLPIFRSLMDLIREILEIL